MLRVSIARGIDFIIAATFVFIPTPVRSPSLSTCRCSSSHPFIVGCHVVLHCIPLRARATQSLHDIYWYKQPNLSSPPLSNLLFFFFLQCCTSRSHSSSYLLAHKIIISHSHRQTSSSSNSRPDTAKCGVRVLLTHHHDSRGGGGASEPCASSLCSSASPAVFFVFVLLLLLLNLVRPVPATIVAAVSTFSVLRCCGSLQAPLRALPYQYVTCATERLHCCAKSALSFSLGYGLRAKLWPQYTNVGWLIDRRR